MLVQRRGKGADRLGVFALCAEGCAWPAQRAAALQRRGPSCSVSVKYGGRRDLILLHLKSDISAIYSTVGSNIIAFQTSEMLELLTLHISVSAYITHLSIIHQYRISCFEFTKLVHASRL